ncbi:transporter, partial [Pontibacterium sp.]|uniref:transporter n=1 Tax=Pontibacterium sp. TaxID=2036026 RepID=UPI00356197A0
MNRALLIGCTGWGLLSLVGSAQAAPITFNTALPVAEGNFILREQAVAMRSGSDPSGMGRDMAVDGVISVLGYGASEKLAVFGALPYLIKDLDIHPDSNHVNRSNSGFGDLTLFGRQTFYQRDWPGQTLRVAGFAGLEAPTGEYDKHDAQGR